MKLVLLIFAILSGLQLGVETEASDLRYGPSAPRVVLQKMVLKVDGRPDQEMDLIGDAASQIPTFEMKEGTEYKLSLHFEIREEIVSGLKYFHSVKRKGLTVDKVSYMVGSYGPRDEEFVFDTPADEVPRGLLARGTYAFSSKFLDDDKIVYLYWQWQMSVTKDWQ